MSLKKLKPLILLTILSFATANASKSITVKMISVSNDQPYADQVRSYVGRELRKLGDVLIVDSDKYDFLLRASVLHLKNQGGQYTGFAISIILTTTTIGDKKNDVYLDDYLRSGPAESLPSDCSEIVAEMDAGYFDSFRKYQFPQP